MKRLITILVLIFVVGIHAATPPTLSYDASKASPFLVTFDAGTFVAACTVYESTTDKWPDGTPYAPAHCGPLADGTKQTAYEDDWDFIVLTDSNNVPVPGGGEWNVYAALYAEDGTETRSNVLRLKH